MKVDDDLKQQLAAANKTITVLMDRVEHAIDTTGGLHNLFEDNLILKDRITKYLRNAEQLRRFNSELEEQVRARTHDLQRANLELNEKNDRLKEMVRRDGLTGLYNHSAMTDLIQQSVNESLRYNHPISVVMFDLDHFKKVNDTYGHPFGDHVLRTVSKVLQDLTRDVDYPSRFGGEEFLLLMPYTNRTGAHISAERIRQTISELEWQPKEFRLTISAGVTAIDNDTAESLASRADQNLYRAKKEGRNRVVVS